MVQELGERVVIKFVTFEGEELELVGYEGESLMQVAKRGDAPSILATCGGNCEASRFFLFSFAASPSTEGLFYHSYASRAREEWCEKTED